MLDVVLPLIDTVFHKEAGDDFIEGGISMLNLLLYKLRKSQQIPNSIWFYFPILCYILGAAPQNVNK